MGKLIMIHSCASTIHIGNIVQFEFTNKQLVLEKKKKQGHIEKSNQSSLEFFILRLLL